MRRRLSTASRRVIDLRSDTVTRPTAAMRSAMQSAEVGDDVWGDDYTTVRLQREAAALLGKEAALFVPSGTMGNIIAAGLHSRGRRGASAVCGDASHIFKYEVGGAAQLWGLSLETVPTQADGTLALGDIRGALRDEDQHYPATALVCLEQTHNLMGGRCLGADLAGVDAYMRSVSALCRERGLALHIDGARLLNAAVALEAEPSELVRRADSVTVCLSKGVGCPAGSVLAGDAQFIEEARRLRKMLGGGMRQVGVLAAPALVGLAEYRETMAQDHRNARRLAVGLDGIGGVDVDVGSVQTNLLFCDLDRRIDGVVLQRRLLDEHGVDMSAGYVVKGASKLRFVTHRDVSDVDIEAVIDAVKASV